MRLLSRTAPALLAIGLLGCHGTTDPATPLQAGGDFTIGVTAGTTPTFSWTGAGANEIHVFRSNDGGYVSPQWDLMSSGAIRSPVQYGSQPTGSRLAGGTSQLVKGTQYRVTVYRSDSRSAYQEFIP